MFAGNVQADLAGEFMDGLNEGQTVEFDQKIQCVAVHAATETMIKLLRWADRERRSFLAMEGTAGEVVRPAFLQCQMRRQDVDDIDANQQILDECLGNHGQERLTGKAGANTA